MAKTKLVRLPRSNMPIGERLAPPQAESAEEFKTVGRSVPRIDGLEKVMGAALFLDDFEFGPNLLYAAVVESTYAHART